MLSSMTPQPDHLGIRACCTRTLQDPIMNFKSSTQCIRAVSYHDLIMNLTMSLNSYFDVKTFMFS